MRVISISNFYDTHGGGLERVAGHLSREFALAGHVSRWAASDADGLPENPAELIGLRCANPTEALTGLPMPLPRLKSIRLLSNVVRNSDVVVIHDALYVTSILAMLFAKVRRKPVVLIQHISAIPFANPLMRGVMRLANSVVTAPMISAADRLVFISQTVRDDLLGTPPARPSQLIFNGVDQTIFHPRPRASREATRNQWQLPVNGAVAIFVGRFVEKKGLHVIRALAVRRPDVHFVLVGKGPISPDDWELVNIHVVGQQPQDVIADLYRTADVLLLPSVGEGYPLVVQEAMACGLPVICGAGSAQADPDASRWLRGVDIDLADLEVSALRCSQALDDFAASPVDTAGMAQYAAQRYSWSRMASKILAGFDVKPN